MIGALRKVTSIAFLAVLPLVMLAGCFGLPGSESTDPEVTRRPPRITGATGSEEDASVRPTQFVRQTEPTEAPPPPGPTVPPTAAPAEQPLPAQPPEGPGPTATLAELLPPGQREDREALEALYIATDGPNWRNNANWMSSAPVGEWFGVETAANGRVVVLDLQENNLSGEIPPELGNLSHLQEIHLYINNLTGEIPPELGLLDSLQFLGLFTNHLGGALPPELGDLAQLRFLHLFSNELTGTIPRELGNLGNLEWLGLDDNQLDGPIPSELGNLSNLERLEISQNRLAAQIPPDLARLSKLEVLRVSGNRLTGTIPQEFAERAGQLQFFAEGNQLTGCISEQLRQKFTENSTTGLPDCASQAPQPPADRASRPAMNPELAVHAFAVGSASPIEELQPGQNITLEAQVRNEGAGESASTTLRYYRSNDNILSARDVQVGTSGVESIRPGAGLSHAIQVAVPSSPGTFYYGACIDAVAGDSNSGNNCLTSTKVVVVSQANARRATPDLVVRNPGRSGSGPVYPGQPFTFEAQVENIGDSQAGPTTLRYYGSGDATITTSDAQVGTDSVASVQSGRSSRQSIQFTAPSSPGTYYYGACVDAVSDESDTANNCSRGVRVSIGTQPKPDLVVLSVEKVGSGPVFVGQQISLQAEVENIGDAQASGTTLRYYRSSDATITTGDVQVGTDSVASVQSSRSSRQSLQFNAPSNVGTYYYGVCVDAVSDESDTANNCSQGVRVSVGTQPKPDLVVLSVEKVGSGPVFVGQQITLQAEVENIGDAQANATTLRYYQSNDGSINTRDRQIRTHGVEPVQPGRNSPQSIQFNAPSSVGTYYYGACVDAVSGESDITNNCSQGVRVSVGTQPKPDLVVRSVGKVESDPLFAGGQFTLQATVVNIGDGAATSARLRYFLSSDANINRSDTPYGTDLTGTVPAGGNSPQSIPVTAPARPGTYYFGACVDAVSGESDITNNCSNSVRVTIGTEPKPDLVVRNVRKAESGPIFVGERFTLQATVVNIGNAAATSARLRYFLSSDANINRSASPFGTDPVGTVPAGGNSPQSIPVTTPARPGTYYFGACVDAVSGESDTANNCSASMRLELTERPTVKLKVDSFKVEDPDPYEGDRIALTATVGNDGNADSSEINVYFFQSSTRAFNSPSNRLVQFEAVMEAQLYLDFLYLHTAPSPAGTYYYGVCVEALSNELNANDKCFGPIRVVVRERARPDLLVRAFSANEGRIDPSDEFTMSTIVRNQGNGGAGRTRLNLYISQNAQVATNSGNILRSFDVAALGPAPDERQLNLVADAPSQIGTYYLRVCVSAPSGESNTQNNCSTTDSIEVRRAFRPDLVAAISYVGESGIIYSGGRYEVSGGVRNYGTATSERTVLRYYRSEDQTISDDDEELGFLGVKPLEPGGGGSGEITALAPRESDVTYYFYVCLDGGFASSDGECSSLIPGRVIEPLYWNNEECSFSDDLFVDNLSFTADIGAFRWVRDARVKGVFVIFLLGVETSRISVDEGFGSLEQYETKEITINRRITSPGHTFTDVDCKLELDWRY